MHYFFCSYLFIFLFTAPIDAFLSSEITPKKAFELLMEGNNRYTRDQLEHPNRNLERRESVSLKQTPFATIIGCSDSRVSPEIVFDQGIGDLFVVRVAGNVLGDIELASVNYSIDNLHSKLIFVLGHENCGAVKAVINNQTQDIEPIANKIEKSLRENTIKFSNNPLENAIKANIRGVVQELRKNKTLKKLIEENKILVVGGY